MRDFSRVLGEEKEREEKHREAGQSPGAPADRAEERTPGVPERGDLTPTRDAPETDRPGREGPSLDIGFDRERPIVVIEVRCSRL